MKLITISNVTIYPFTVAVYSSTLPIGPIRSSLILIRLMYIMHCLSVA